MTDHLEPPVVDDVPLHAIRTDGGTQPRTEIDEAVVAEYAEAMRAGAILPPVILFFDGVAFWLADGFHRYHAAVQAGLGALHGEVRTGTRRDAVLYSVGANASHGLRRTNADKRRAVTMLLQDDEWVQWSDSAIARQCGVSQPFVASVRAAIIKRFDDSVSENQGSPANLIAPATRTVTRNGTTYEQKVKAKPAPSAEPAPPAAVAEEAQTRTDPLTGETFKAVDRPAVRTPDPWHIPASDVVLTEADQLRAENEALREQLADLKADLRETLTDNEDMARILEADDQVKAALAEVARYKALLENAERTLAARSHEFNERARNVVYWKNRAEKAEKQLAKVA